MADHPQTGTTRMVTLKIDWLEFRYGPHPVFSGVSFSIDRSQVVAIVGRNGAGKSTLLKCINMILKPVKGSVQINGDNVLSMNQRQRARQIGYLAQKCEQLFPSTVFDTVLTGRFPHSPVRFTRRDEEITADVLEMMGLGKYAHRQFNQLSGGEQQQVLIARALTQGADILLFDEPTNNLDLQHQLQIMQLIRKLAHEKGIISVLAIHDLNFASAFSDTVILVHNGTVFAKGTPFEVFTKDNIREAFGIEVKIYDHHGIPHIAVAGM